MGPFDPKLNALTAWTRIPNFHLLRSKNSSAKTKKIVEMIYHVFSKRIKILIGTKITFYIVRVLP